MRGLQRVGMCGGTRPGMLHINRWPTICVSLSLSPCFLLECRVTHVCVCLCVCVCQERGENEHTQISFAPNEDNNDHDDIRPLVSTGNGLVIRMLTTCFPVLVFVACLGISGLWTVGSLC